MRSSTGHSSDSVLYADYNGSAPVLPQVADYVAKRMHQGPHGNPNAVHGHGIQLKQGLEECRQRIARQLGAGSEQVFFTSGSSEGLSQVIGSESHRCSQILSSSIEHAAVLAALEGAQNQHQTEIFLHAPNKQGVVEKDAFVEKIDKLGPASFVTLMAANNETGAYQPWREVASACRRKGIAFLSDTTQIIGKDEFSFEDSGLDYAVASSHKLGALGGSGILLAREPERLAPLVFGGGQEKGLRGGTQHMLGIESMVIALDLASEKQSEWRELQSRRDEFERGLKDALPEIIIFSEDASRLSGTTLLSYPGLHGQAIQIELESQNIFVTTSSACGDNEPDPSHVLVAMGEETAASRGVVRISLHWSSPVNAYERIYEAMKKAVAKLTRIQSY